ncbi:mitochondrial 37S ribosomal protein RSM18 [Coccidioides immitis RS]|uniref:Small ribosomal subunit protein bS18m n=7 Tax=Coccidioides TaxID=5500 RepID=J3KI60_COCIM|nr:mitochondrial 37S ribosomal protein RSM18 [Coccidioides immitis RS]XP_003066145.1 mitochondrial 37S ribosomal protein RSM18 [Coccidioides posadasii C735 delta SOWgp]EFW22076.1 37S ribosomal protein S18 [Coccidioides posadasii str. Silveira]KMM65543.1 hypothetical protein CPAG_01892 [Coccidioides posadasii RMSCC 3488]KMP00893.1 66 kDa stress protein [Coccidioides immitis RMSCC 2394]KMU72873.1 hypothetical protein CISG_03307 [Coccidioides immitis RMSCC 3703]KMU83403.1 WD repeat-containing pr|eukprot:XP_003066145.1 mitochondrial 37S ribosomal protein RSM18 [Coccidioides posadasii C735 delta SOWgp]
MSSKLNPFSSHSFVRPANLQHIRRLWSHGRVQDPSKAGGYSAYQERKMAIEQKDRRISQSIAAQRARDEKLRTMERYQTREWKAGDVYAPHDLSPAEMKKWRKRHSPNIDVFDALAMDPLDQYKNFSIMSEYMTEMGRIKPRSVTGLRPVNQRKMAKAIRRAIGLGLMPSVYQHPEILLLKNRR